MRDDRTEGELATWQILAQAEPALALFSSREAAETYAAARTNRASWTAFQPPRRRLLEIFITAYRAGTRHAVVDPAEEGARQLFRLAEVLQSARAQIDANRT